ncbi:GNAT family N-acetyltransferase [Solicola sp. PLA-1-18]|uniref:GNAT family N-acetyltransferase n=1 Tax=Solicola sp. PLA-1-18 TaxID=3380532 RepID=UPI003B7D7181
MSDERSTGRALTSDDAAAVTAVVAASEAHDDGVSLIEEEDVAADWRRDGFDLARQARGWEVDGRLVACAELHHGRLENYVHPAARGRGLGTEALRWSLDLARSLGESSVAQTLAVGNAAAIALLEAHGFEPSYESWVLGLPSGASLPDAQLPDGYALRDYVPGTDERVAYDVIEGAFGEWPGRRAKSFDDWRTTTVGREDFEPWQVRLVEGPDGVVAACVSSLPGDTGWVDQLAVAAPHRRRGIAQALLADAFATTRARGAVRAELNTDSRTGALGLYLAVGMEVVRSYRNLRLTLDA